MSNAVNMLEEVKLLAARPRGNACIVLTHDYVDQKTWAAELAKQTDSEHIDFLEHFTNRSEIAAQVGQYSATRLFEYLKSRSASPVLIVSGLEFIKATWVGHPNSREQFASRVEMWNAKPSLLFVMQYDNILANFNFNRYKQYKFVIDQKETLAL